MSLLFRAVRVFAPELPAGSTPPTDVLVVGDRIRAIGDEAARLAPPDARAVEGFGHHLLMPGLINGHFHSPVNHMKGALPSLPLELFMLYESPALDALRPTPREAYLRTMLGAVEMLRRGTTAVQDDAFFVPHPTPDIVDAVMAAYRDSGIRATVALDQPELPELDKLPFLAELLPSDLRAELAAPPAFGRADLLAAVRHLVDTWHGAAEGRLAAAMSVSAPQRVSPEYFAELDAISRDRGLPLYAHMLETKLQRALRDEQPRFGGRSLVRYTADLGLLSSRVNVIHAIWVDGDDLDLLAASGAAVAHNPISNLRLGSGVMPFRALRERGVPICLGTDEAIADDAVNMWAVAKMTGLVHNIADPDPDRWPTATEVLDCLLRGGARAMLKTDDLGTIAEGRLADLALLDLHALPFTPLNDLPRQLVYCEDGTSVRMTVVAGAVAFDGARVAGVDEAALLDEARELFARRRPALEEARRAADRWLPAYRGMVARAAARDVGMRRRIDSTPGTEAR